MAESVESGSLMSPAPGLTATTVAEFRELVVEEQGVSLELDDAWRRASQLVALYRMLMGPIPEDGGVQTRDRMPAAAVENDLVVR
jgi:hypothetical protein